MDLKDRFYIEFNSKMDYIRVVRGALRAFLKLKNIVPSQIFDVELALNEAIINVIKHTYHLQPDHALRITMIWDDDERSCTFLLEDDGKPVPLESIVSRDLGDVKDHGLGVFIIKSMMDEVLYSVKEDASGNQLMMKKYLLLEEKR